MRKLKTLGSVIALTGFCLLYYIYDWKLTLIMFRIIFGNNLEQKL
jgi:hypothetical protein